MTTRPQHRRVGSVAAVIVTALAVAAAGGQTETPGVRRFDLRSKAAPQEGSVVLRRGEQWSGELTLGQGYLEIDARLNRAQPPGSSYALEVSVNGQPVISPPLNTPTLARDAGGRTVPYLEPGGHRWRLFTGPDLLPDNRPAGGGSVVEPGPGQLSRYVWDVRPLLRGGAAALVRVRNLADVSGEAIQVRVRDGAAGASPGDIPALRSSPGVARQGGLGAPAGFGRISNIVTALEVRQGQAIGITDQFTPEVNPIYVWFRVSGFATGTALLSRWLYLGGREPVVVGTAEARVKPDSDHGAFSLELAPGKRWPAGDYRAEILADGNVIGSAPFTVIAR